MLEKLHNRLITLIVGKKPVIMNVDITLAPGVFTIKDTILMNKNTKIKGFNIDYIHCNQDILKQDLVVSQNQSSL